jgi:hypothetical protein
MIVTKINKIHFLSFKTFYLLRLYLPFFSANLKNVLGQMVRYILQSFPEGPNIMKFSAQTNLSMKISILPNMTMKNR